MDSQPRLALGRVKDVLWAVAIAGLVAGTGRFIFGLGAATNMMDALPWGWWKVFNMVAGAALATSGFVVASIIYILRLERFQPVARLSVVVGFLGYGSSLVALLFDIGLPHRGWHPFFMWNPHSFLFEVFWCVSLYWGVTALELVPIVTERLGLRRFTHWLHERMLPFVVLGITLSTMHHSSLGSLFMTSPTRLHPLWHSFWIPPEFFISAMGGGLAAIVWLSMATSSLYRREIDRGVMRKLAVGSGSFLLLYLLVKAADFTVNGKWSFVLGPDITWESVVFWVEITLQVLIPVVCFLTPLRFSRVALGIGVHTAFVGLVMHRLDTGIVGYFRSSGAIYVPNLSELLLSFGVLSAAGLAYFFLVERFIILDPERGEKEEFTPWTQKELRGVLFGPGARRAWLIVLIATPLTILTLRDQATGAFRPTPQPVATAVRAIDPNREILRLDGNRNNMHVDFHHTQHQIDLARLRGTSAEETCIECHHLSLPGDKATSCRHCHADMESDTPFFDLAKHESRFETENVRKAVLGADLRDGQRAYRVCATCHEENMAGLHAYEHKGFRPVASGFKHAMHGSCLTCHRQREEVLGLDPSHPMSSGNCLYCHRHWADESMLAEVVDEHGHLEVDQLPRR
jgi:Ni/Fe-hydrogenase subunit HybB-like protein